MSETEYFRKKKKKKKKYKIFKITTATPFFEDFFSSISMHSSSIFHFCVRQGESASE